MLNRRILKFCQKIILNQRVFHTDQLHGNFRPLNQVDYNFQGSQNSRLAGNQYKAIIVVLRLINILFPIYGFGLLMIQALIEFQSNFCP